MSNTTNSAGQVIVKSGGLVGGLSGLAAILTIIFVCAKLFAGATFTWLQVFLPIIIVWGGGLAILLSILGIGLIIGIIVLIVNLFRRYGLR